MKKIAKFVLVIFTIFAMVLSFGNIKEVKADYCDYPQSPVLPPASCPG